MIEKDAELGPVRWCRTCQEWWPDDEQFWARYTIPAGAPTGRGYFRKKSSLIIRCRACYAERARAWRKARRPRISIVGRVVETADGTFLEPVGGV